MKDLVWKVSKPVGSVLDAFAFSVTTAKTVNCLTSIDNFWDVRETLVTWKSRWPGLCRFMLISFQALSLI